MAPIRALSGSIGLAYKAWGLLGAKSAPGLRMQGTPNILAGLGFRGPPTLAACWMGKGGENSLLTPQNRGVGGGSPGSFAMGPHGPWAVRTGHGGPLPLPPPHPNPTPPPLPPPTPPHSLPPPPTNFGILWFKPFNYAPASGVGGLEPEALKSGPPRRPWSRAEPASH